MSTGTVRRDRAAGVLLATAAGDALGAPYEFGPPLPATTEVTMTGGGSFGWAVGEWTDDTSMAIAIAELAATGADLQATNTHDAIVRRWVGWAETATDVGIQTRQVLAASHSDAATVTAAAEALHHRTGRSGGNGSLMRTAPVALAYLGDDDVPALIDAATRISALTHFDPEAGEACVLWCLAIRHAVRTGELDLRRGLRALAPDRAAVWADRIDVAERSAPADFAHNGWVVEALQAAWCAIATTPVPRDDSAAGTFRVQHLQHALEAAVRGGHDTDTVAAIAGGLLGAAYGASAVPARWRRVLHGWPGLHAQDLIRLGLQIVRVGRPGWPDVAVFDYSGLGGTSTVARHPADDGIWLGGVDALAAPPSGVDAVVSLCRIGYAQTPPGVRPEDHVVVWLVDADDPLRDNPNLGFVLHDTVAVLRELRAEGRTVLLHCVQAQTRTPAVAALYAAGEHGSVTDALDDLVRVLPVVDRERVRRLLAAARS